MNSTLKYGLLAGVLSSVLMVVLRYVSFDFSQSMTGGLIGIVVPIVFMVLAIKAVRELQEGFISFGEALKTSFLVFMICALISGVVGFALFQTYTDNDWNRIVEIQKESTKDMMEMVGADVLTMDAALEELTVEKIKRIYIWNWYCDVDFTREYYNWINNIIDYICP